MAALKLGPLACLPPGPTLARSVVPARAGGAMPTTRASPPRSAHPAAARAGDGRPVPLAAGGEGPRMVSIVLADSPVRLVMASPGGAPPASQEGGERRLSLEGG